jgi:hypothetical protein
MTKAPACFTSTRNSVFSACLADTVTVSTTSRRPGCSSDAPVCRSRLICGFQLPSTRGPAGDSKEQSFR